MKLTTDQEQAALKACEVKHLEPHISPQVAHQLGIIAATEWMQSERAEPTASEPDVSEERQCKMIRDGIQCRNRTNDKAVFQFCKDDCNFGTVPDVPSEIEQLRGDLALARFEINLLVQRLKEAGAK